MRTPVTGKGKLKVGGTPGNKGGGRTPDRIRRKLAQIVATEGIGVIREVLQDADAKTSDKLRAVDVAAKYGIGASNELTREKVRDLLQQTITVTSTHLPALIESMPPEQVADALFQLWAPIWE
jgi:hypothetical protein